MKNNLAPTKLDNEAPKISIGVTSLGYLSAQQKWILAASKNHLRNHPKDKILVVSFYTEVGIFKQNNEQNVVTLFNDIDFVNWNNYLKPSQELDLISMVKSYDVVLWDLPEIEFIKKWDQAFSVYMSYIKELKILSPRATNIEQNIYLKNTLSYFREHGIPFDERLSSSSTPRRIKD